MSQEKKEDEKDSSVLNIRDASKKHKGRTRLAMTQCYIVSLTT